MSALAKHQLVDNGNNVRLGFHETDNCVSNFLEFSLDMGFKWGLNEAQMGFRWGLGGFHEAYNCVSNFLEFSLDMEFRCGV